MMISIYGAGYVGLVTAVCLAKLGNQVICADINQERIAQLLRGESPIYEDQLTELLEEAAHVGLLSFTSDISHAIQQGSVHMIAVGTPGLADGSADLSYVFGVAAQIAREVDRDSLIVIKSTVPVGTGDRLEKHIQDVQKECNKRHRINVVSNPEFLREGNAVNDFLHADRIILGGDMQALAPIKAVYQKMAEQNIPIQCMSRLSAELTKYTANAMLACKISFMNQISQIADQVGANIDEIRQGISSDHRIGPHFLQAGIGYGGSCFPKDVRALVQTAKELGIDSCLLEAIDLVNDEQKNWAVNQLMHHFNHELQNLTIGIWGLSFKPGTDDMREASSLVIIDSLLAVGVKLRVYDPVAMSAAQKQIRAHKALIWCDSADDVLAGVLDALVIATEWPIFKNYSLGLLKKALGEAPIIDGRNCYELERVKAAGLASYYSVGRPLVCAREELEIA